jgi:hypothetical protein
VSVHGRIRDSALPSEEFRYRMTDAVDNEKSRTLQFSIVSGGVTQLVPGSEQLVLEH